MYIYLCVTRLFHVCDKAQHSTNTYISIYVYIYIYMYIFIHIQTHAYNLGMFLLQQSRQKRRKPSRNRIHVLTYTCIYIYIHAYFCSKRGLLQKGHMCLAAAQGLLRSSLDLVSNITGLACGNIDAPRHRDSSQESRVVIQKHHITTTNHRAGMWQYRRTL